MILNQNVDFAHVDPAMKRAFPRAPEKVRLDARAQLHNWPAGQPEFAKEHVGLRHVFLIGGAWQVWIPNLTERHVTALPVVA